MKTKEAPPVTISAAEYALLNYEASMFYQYLGIGALNPREEAKLRRLDRKANP
jgi:hypothetical protein